MIETLHVAFKKLRLSGLTPSLDVRRQEATANHLSHAEFLEILLQDELAVRQDRLVQRRTKVAAFREPKTLEDFDWQFNPSIRNSASIRRGLSDQWDGAASAVFGKCLEVGLLYLGG